MIKLPVILTQSSIAFEFTTIQYGLAHPQPRVVSDQLQRCLERLTIRQTVWFGAIAHSLIVQYAPKKAGNNLLAIMK